MAILTLDAAVDKFAQAIDVNTGTVVRKLTLDIFSGITTRTPVDTGRARASWMVTEGQPSNDVPSADGFKKGTTAPPPTPPNVSAIDGKKSVFIVSSLDYIEPLENGHSSQAPAGMVAVTLAEVEAKIEDALTNLQQ
jgi:hypothetical protein